MKNGISIIGGLQRIRQAAEDGTMALKATVIQVPDDVADFALSNTQAWTTEKHKDSFLSSLNNELSGEYDFSFNEFGGDVILEITGM